MPWARILGMAVTVAVTLTCVVAGIEPVEILRRAALSFVIVATLTYLVTSTLQALAKRPNRSMR